MTSPPDVRLLPSSSLQMTRSVADTPAKPPWSPFPEAVHCLPAVCGRFTDRDGWTIGAVCCASTMLRASSGDSALSPDCQGCKHYCDIFTLAS
eukprot:850035-Pleurochrysis_carterae.AAC.7